MLDFHQLKHHQITHQEAPTEPGFVMVNSVFYKQEATKLLGNFWNMTSILKSKHSIFSHLELSRSIGASCL